MSRMPSPPPPRSAGSTIVIGFAGTVLAFALYICTGMVYACLPFLREWATPLTVINYTLLGLASGFALAATATLAAPPLVRFFAACALTLTLLGFATRAASLARNARLRPKSTLQTAIGIKHPRIVQTSQGFMGGSFNTREFFMAAARRSSAPSGGASSSAHLWCPRCCSRRRGRARRRSSSCWVSPCSTWACSPSDGTSSRRRTTRRTSTTRRPRNLARLALSPNSA